MTRNLHRSRPEQVADYLRGCLERGELVDPLPGTRAWSTNLDISRPTLERALQILRREGWLVIEPRKPVRLHAGAPARSRSRIASPQIVRLLYHGTDYSVRTFLDWYPDLGERLHSHGIGLTLERCTLPRLKVISRQAPNAHELLFLLSIPVTSQPHFAALTRNALIVGNPAPGSPLPFVTVDLRGLVAHATQFLLRRGLTRISLVIDKSPTQGNQEAPQVVQATCADWARGPIQSEIVRLPLTATSLLPAARQFAARVRPRHGILVVQPVPLGMIMTALLEQRIAIPESAEVVGLLTTPESVQLCPALPHYPFPIRPFVRQLTETALHYFETVGLPRLRKAIPVEMIVPPGW